MDNRNLFEELQAGLKDAKAFEEEKITLKTMTIESNEQATTLFALTNKYPDMFDRLKTI